MTIRTRQISAAEVLPLRLEVLRPGRPPESAVFGGDEDPSTTHWGALDGAGKVVAIATLMQSPKPGTTDAAWQVRGMASSPQVRGQGYGAAALQAVMDYVAQRDPRGLIWCNARSNAVGFYRDFGFVTEGAEFEIPGVGPHWVMSRHV